MTLASLFFGDFSSMTSEDSEGRNFTGNIWSIYPLPLTYSYITFKYPSTTRSTYFGDPFLSITLSILTPKIAGITPVLRNT